MGQSEVLKQRVGFAKQETSLEGWIDFVVKLRARRKELFGPDLFSDPAWEILLALAGAGGSLSLKIIADAISCGPSTTMRWLKLLESHGHVLQITEEEFELTHTARSLLPKVIC